MTQYDRILRMLREAGEFGLSYRHLIIGGGSNCPHKRLAELEQRGFRFSRQRYRPAPDKPFHTMVRLLSEPTISTAKRDGQK